MTTLAISPNASGSGQFTLTAPNSSNNRTLSLPDVDGTILHNAATAQTLAGGITVPSMNGGQLAGYRNKIINGKMDISQRGTSFAAVASDTFTLDRYPIIYISSALATVTQSTDVPSSNEFQSSLRIAVTTADTTISAGDFYNVRQRVEGYNARDLIGRTFTLSFWVRSSKTGTHCVAFANGAHDRSYVAEYTISVANAWEFKTITVTGGLITAGTWNWTDGNGLQVIWSLATGSTYHTTAGAWQTGLFAATANQVNCLDANTNIFALTGVQLEVGSVATPFEHRPYSTELALCQRYLPYTKSAGGGTVSGVGQATSSTSAIVGHSFQVPARVYPTGITPKGAASAYRVTNSSGGTIQATAITFYSGSTSIFGLVTITVSSGLTAGNSTLFFTDSDIIWTGCEL